MFKVPVTKIVSIRPHPNADRLSIATVYGFEVVVQKDRYNTEDFIVYVPVDSILDPKLEDKLFPIDSKIKLNKHRIRAAKIRGFVSQGMIIDPNDLDLKDLSFEQDLAELLKITKYEPQVKMQNLSTKTGLSRNKNIDHKLFHSFNGIDNIKWYPEHFKEGEEVVITEKIHGSHCRLGYLPLQSDSLYKRFLSWLGIAPKYEINYGSNNVQISRKRNYVGFYGEDVYGSTLKRLGAFKRIQPNEIVYGEIIGEGIQKNYDYGHKEPHFVLFDVKVYNENTKEFTWLLPEEVEVYAKERGFDVVPTLYKGPYNKEAAYALTKGPSIYDPNTKVREGIVIKSRLEYNNEHMPSGHKLLKWIADEYLLDQDNTDNH